MQTNLPPQNKPTLGVFKLLMIAIVSVDSIRNLPVGAQYGTALVTFYLIAGIAFFAPLAMITAFLAKRYPQTGGSYGWVQQAFGAQWGFVSIWLQWIYNVIWYPTIFAFTSSTLASLIHPALSQSHVFILVTSLSLFWLITLNNCYGVSTFSRFSTLSAVLGTLLPMSVIILLAGFWLCTGHVSATPLTLNALIPDANNMANLTFFANILFGLLGIDVIAMHATDVKNPQSTYRRALLWAWLIILGSLTFSSLALCVVIPAQHIGLLNGLMAAFMVFFDYYQLAWMKYFIGGAIILGSLGIASSWIIGLARGLHVASFASRLPKVLQQLNRYHMPQNILILQGIIFTLLLSVFMLFPNVNHSYWILSSMTAQFALLYYVLLFIAAFKLIYQAGQIKKYGVWIVLAVLTSIIGVAVGFLPPSSMVASREILGYELTLCGGGLIFFMPLLFFLKKRSIKGGQ